MKNLITSLLFLLSTSYTFSQCEPPVVTNWLAEDNTNFHVEFLAAENSSQYLINFVSLYNNNISPLNQYSVTWSGICNSGLNTVTHNPDAGVDLGLEMSSYYYKVELATICNNDTIWGDDFYMSRNSLLNNEGFECSENFFMPFTFLPDNGGSTYMATFDIVEGDIPLQIDDLEVFVDIGHTYNGDLSIALISPQGTVVSLMDFFLGLGGSHGMSILFVEGGVNPQNTNELGNSISGIFGPADSFEAFEGELVSGTWTLSITDNIAADYGYLFGVCLSMNTSICTASISGESYFDMNSNNVRDDEELPSSYTLINTGLDSYTVTNSNGEYIKCFDEGPIIVELENISDYYTVSPTTYNLTLTNDDYLDSVDFALQPIPGIEDLALNLSSITPDRPGFDNTYYLNYNNIGTECIVGASIDFNVDENLIQIINVESEELITDISTTNLTVELDTICPFESGQIQIEINVNEDAVISDSVFYSACIYPLVSDENEEDNCNDLLSIIVGSYDPNDKIVSHEVIDQDFIDDEKKLEYLIRFQNTGNWYAENVVITDLIDEDLIINSFELIDTSHPVEILVEENTFSFNFDDIFLPSNEVDEDGSNGFIRFKIQPNSNFSMNDIIENNAEIYFDFNDPIITNTVTTILENPIGIEEFTSVDILFYPNPTSDNIIVSDPLYNIRSFKIYNPFGSLIKQGALVNKTIPTSGLASGMYIIEFFDADQKRLNLQKFIRL